MLLAQQKKMMLEKQKMSYNPQKGTVTKNDNRPNFNNINNFNTKINYDHLSKIVENEKLAQYEPGTHNRGATNLPELKKEDNLIKRKEYEVDDITYQKSKENINKTDKYEEYSYEDSNRGRKELKSKTTEDEYYAKLKEQSKKDFQPAKLEKKKTEEENNSEEEEEVEKVQPNTNPAPQTARIVSDMEITNMKEFLTKPLPKGIILQCSIKREKSGFNRFYPKYHLGLSSGFKYLMSAKKKPYNKTSNYQLSMSKSDITKKNDNFLAKLRSNFLGTEFNIYDNGDNPKKAVNVSKDTNILGTKGPRKMRVLIPDAKENGEMYQWKPLKKNEGMLQSFKNGKIEGIRFLFNKPPKWNEHVQAFVLNFNGRVDKPSVKNFQLIDEKDENYIYLLFGRVEDDMFNMDVQWPLSIVQAFAICLSSFDYKLACE